MIEELKFTAYVYHTKLMKKKINEIIKAINTGDMQL